MHRSAALPRKNQTTVSEKNQIALFERYMETGQPGNRQQQVRIAKWVQEVGSFWNGNRQFYLLLKNIVIIIQSLRMRCELCHKLGFSENTQNIIALLKSREIDFLFVIELLSNSITKANIQTAQYDSFSGNKFLSFIIYCRILILICQTFNT